ncbi:DUF3558 domain-containing protein [Saccharopolyspora sp. HNM0986]|uniref:DUF3558 domain-containing protein n=1 Tax=Saccharopolyspora galaxeae TaxID=2781241 RepID=UPI00190BE133|nr:DUF3558 domain-containing protein [Saccharopolyspora sp. HNM0986]MBK0867503.1 DUF3558 domain-containing protein [Saccharopolyspora sp. HNM0986]
MSTTTSLGRIGVAVACAVLFAVTAGGCTVNGATGTSQPAPTSEAGDEQPARPRELAIAGLTEPQICGLIKPEQEQQIGAFGPSPAPKDGTLDFPGCIWQSPAGGVPYGIGVAVAPMGLDELLGQKDPGSPETAATYTVGEGFRAVQSQTPGAEGLGCVVDVDVAEGQALEVNIAMLQSQALSNQEQCAKAKQAAELVVTNLQAQG